MGEQKLLGVYFSGTGNTKFCMEKFLMAYQGKVEMISIEDNGAINKIKESQNIIFGYPVQYSNIPKLVKDYIIGHKEIWQGKNIYIVTTMGMFSGDGAGMSARLLKKYGAHIIGGLHIKMPDSVGDVKALKRPLEKNKQIVQAATKKASAAAQKLKAGKPSKNGLGLISHMLGLFGQRLYFYNKTKNYSDQLKINNDVCIQCGKCTKLCPMQNLTLKDGNIQAAGNCTMCYRCINNCPKQAITLIGKKVVEQSRVEKYV